MRDEHGIQAMAKAGLMSDLGLFPTIQVLFASKPSPSTRRP